MLVLQCRSFCFALVMAKRNKCVDLLLYMLCKCEQKIILRYQLQIELKGKGNQKFP